MPSQHCKMVPTIRFTAFDQCELVAGNDFSALALVTALRNNHWIRVPDLWYHQLSLRRLGKRKPFI